MSELKSEELLFIDGGIDLMLIVNGTVLVLGCIGVATTVGLPVLASGALCAFSGLGGAAIGTGIASK